MKVTVITDDKGNVLGTMRSAGKEDGLVTSSNESDQKATEVDVSDDVANGPAEELHKAVARGGKK
jgi:hypothetical protein